MAVTKAPIQENHLQKEQSVPSIDHSVFDQADETAINATDTESEQPEKQTFLSNLVQETLQTINRADEEEALARVQKAREKHPNDTPDQLAERIIRKYCMQAGAIGAVTASPTMIPGLGTVVALTFGTAVDMRMTYKLQGEMVLELIEIYQPAMSADNKRNVLMVVTGLSMGAGRVVAQSGQKVAVEATERLAARFSSVATREVAAEVTEGAATGLVAKSVSTVFGVATSAGINAVTTYTIARRAQAYLQQGPEAMDDWTASLRTVTGVDERKLTAWLIATTRNSWQLIRRQSTSWAAKLVDVSTNVGEAAKELYVVQAEKTGNQIVDASTYLAQKGDSTMTRLLELGRSTGEGMVNGTGSLVESIRDRFRTSEDERTEDKEIEQTE